MRGVVGKLNLLQKSQIGKMTHLLVNAGFRSKDAVYVFAFFQLVCPIAALIVALLMLKIDFHDPFAVKWKPLALLFSVWFGYKLPNIMVANQRGKRYHAIRRALADTLDLMMICAEAGLSLAAALERVSRELGMTYPEMAEELGLTSIEIGFLPERKKALSNLAARVDMPEIRNIVSVLIQTEKYGTPITQALRVLSAEFRAQRMLRAEQKAARLPAIMTVPMIVFILPTLFVVVLAPAIVKLLYQM
jgi:tight adherence protein C